MQYITAQAQLRAELSMSGTAVLHGGVLTSSSSESESSSLWLERAGFTGGSMAISCEDIMRAALMLSGPRLRTHRPAAAAACCVLRCLSITLCLVRAIVHGIVAPDRRCMRFAGSHIR